MEIRSVGNNNFMVISEGKNNVPLTKDDRAFYFLVVILIRNYNKFTISDV